MVKSISPFDELRIRKFPYDKKVRLVRLANQEGKSLQEFLFDALVKLADNEEVIDIQYRMAQQQKETNQVVQKNSETLFEVQKVLKYIAGDD